MTLYKNWHVLKLTRIKNDIIKTDIIKDDTDSFQDGTSHHPTITIPITWLLIVQSTNDGETHKAKSELKELMEKKMKEMEGVYAAKVGFFRHKLWKTYDRYRSRLRSEGNISGQNKGTVLWG